MTASVTSLASFQCASNHSWSWLDLACALNLDVQLDVLGQPRPGEVARADQRLRADDLELGVRDVRLGVELVLVVDAALDLA